MKECDKLSEGRNGKLRDDIPKTRAVYGQKRGMSSLYEDSKSNSMTRTKTYGLTHLAIAVSDIERTLSFYHAVFDMEVMYHEKDMLQLTTPGCHDILVFEEKKDQKPGITGGIVHFGFRLREAADIEEMNQKIIDAGGIIVDKGEFVPGSPYTFFKDPDGYIVEVWYELVNIR